MKEPIRLTNGRCVSCNQTTCICPEALRWYETLLLVLAILAVLGVMFGIYVLYNVIAYDDWRCAISHCVRMKP